MVMMLNIITIHKRMNLQRRNSQSQQRPSATFAPHHNRRNHRRGNYYLQCQRRDRTRQVVSEVDRIN